LIEAFGILVVRIYSLLANMKAESLSQGESNLRRSMKQQEFFEPLFSTKRGAGMGIGLAVVREIIEGLGGHISVESQPGFGTLFILELPPAP